MNVRRGTESLKKPVARNGYYSVSKGVGVTLVMINRQRNQGRENTTRRRSSCLRASGNAENVPTTGKRSSNMHFGQSSNSMKKFAPSSSLARRRLNVPKKPEPVNARCTTRPDGLSKKAWRACFDMRPPHLLIKDAVSHKRCAN